jgi:hypothetical protein
VETPLRPGAEIPKVGNPPDEPRVGTDGRPALGGRPRTKTITVEVPIDYPEPDVPEPDEPEDEDPEDDEPGMDPAVVWLEAFSSYLNARGGVARFWDGLRHDDQVILQNVLGRLTPRLEDITHRMVKNS